MIIKSGLCTHIKPQIINFVRPVIVRGDDSLATNILSHIINVVDATAFIYFLNQSELVQDCLLGSNDLMFRLYLQEETRVCLLHTGLVARPNTQAHNRLLYPNPGIIEAHPYSL
jgi:hypothetical protein